MCFFTSNFPSSNQPTNERISDMPKCAGTTKALTPCKNPSTKGCEYCSTHRPKSAESPPAIGGPSTPPPESPKKVLRTVVPTCIKDDNDSAQLKNMENKFKFETPVIVRTASDKAPKIAADVGGVYSPFVTGHWLSGINGTTCDKTSHRKGWIGMLRDLAVQEAATSTSDGLDFNKLEELAALHGGLTTCCAAGCDAAATVGAHVWVLRGKGRRLSKYDVDSAYIVPSCSFHNNHDNDANKAVFLTNPNTPAMKMVPLSSYKDYIQK